MTTDSSSTVREPTVAEPLVPDQPRHRTIAEGEVHLYEVDVPADHFLSVTVEQEGTDVRLALQEPGGEEVVWADNPNSDRGPETAVLVAHTGGVHRVEVRASSKGEYTVQADPPRPATEADRKRAAGMAALARGWGLRHEASALEDPEAAGAVRDRAVEALRGAYQDCLEAGAEREGGLALYYLGWVLEEAGRPAEAIEAFTGALERLAGREDLAAALQEVGYERAALLLRQGETERAQQAALALREDAIEAGSLEFQRGALTLLGRALHREGKRFEALDAYGQALEVARQEGSPLFEANLLLHVGRIYVELGELEDAAVPLGRAVEIARQQDNPAYLSVALLELGNLQLSRGQRGWEGDGAEATRDPLRAARSALEEALTIQREQGDQDRIPSTLFYLGQLHLEMGELEAAEDRFRESLEVARESRNPREEAAALHKLGRQRFQAGELAEALDLHRRAAGLFSEAGDRQHALSARFGTARVLHRQDRHGEALKVLEGVLQEAEELRDTTAVPDLQASWLSTRSHYWELYVDTLMHLQEAGSPGADLLALAAAERWRARNLLDQVRMAGADLRRGADPKLLAQERTILRELRGIGPHEATGSGADERRRQLLADLRLTRERIRRSSPAASRLDPEGSGSAVGDPKAVSDLRRRTLGAGDLVLVYSLGDERSFLWAVSRQGVESRVLPAREEIETLAEEVARGLRSAAPTGEPKLRHRAGLLSNRVLGPVRDLLVQEGEGRPLRFPRLAVVADGALQAVPFAALPLPERAEGGDDGELLIDHREVVHLPSLQALPALRRMHADREPAPRTVAVLADPVFQADDPRLGGKTGHAAPATARERSAGRDDLRRLPGTRREANAILALVPPEERLAAVDFEANREVILSGRLKDYRVLHFATHGRADRRQPALSGLALSAFGPDGGPRESFLWMHELYGLELPAELVVLSACETGLGRAYRGEGLVGLARGFMYAGAPRLVVSLWPVEDEATSTLMHLFYRNLLERRMAPAAALRDAQRSLRREDRWRHPYYWGGFVFVGDWATGASLVDPDLPIEEPVKSTVNDPPPPHSIDDLPLVPELEPVVRTADQTAGGDR